MDMPRSTVLIVDPDERALIELERALENAGFETTTAWSSKEALYLLSTRHYIFCIVGHHPPQVDAAILLPLLRTRFGVRSIALDSAEHPFEAEFLEWLGACGVVSKQAPQFTEEVLDSVRRAVLAKAAERARDARPQAAAG